MKSDGRPTRSFFRTLVAVAALLALLWPAAARARESKLQTVRLGYIPLISFAPVFIAIEKGYFAHEGLRIKLTQFGAGAGMVPALATGELDVSSGTASAGLFNSIAEGMNFKIVADKGQNRPGYGYTALVVRRDLIASGRYKSLKDLAGMKIATLPGKGVVTEYALYKILQYAGVSPDTVQTIGLAPPNQVKALASKAVDAIVTAEPWGTVAQNRGLGKIIPTDHVPALEALQVAMIMYSGKFIKDEPGAARKFMAAYVKGIHYYNEKGLKNNEVADILFKYTKVKPQLIKDSIPFYLSNNGSPELKSITAQEEWYLKRGYIKKEVPLARAVDLQFIREAEGR